MSRFALCSFSPISRCLVIISSKKSYTFCHLLKGFVGCKRSLMSPDDVRKQNYLTWRTGFCLALFDLNLKNIPFHILPSRTVGRTHARAQDPTRTQTVWPSTRASRIHHPPNVLFIFLLFFHFLVVFVVISLNCSCPVFLWMAWRLCRWGSPLAFECCVGWEETR